MVDDPHGSTIRDAGAGPTASTGSGRGIDGHLGAEVDPSSHSIDHHVEQRVVGIEQLGVDEITAAATVMRELAKPVSIDGDHLVDTCGTGGDGAKTFNISTASAFVVAAAGGQVAKHGNRSISSNTGSADVLEAAGVNLGIAPEQVAQCVNELGVGFMFAPAHHGAMKHAIGPRKEMAVRTIFNVLGPLTNPAGAPNQIIGVFHDELVELMANVLNQLESHHVMVVHAEDGLDEISISAPTHVAELKDGKVSSYTIKPSDFGMDSASLEQLRVNSPEQSLDMIRAVLADNAAALARINANSEAVVADIEIAGSPVFDIVEVRGILHGPAFQGVFLYQLTVCIAKNIAANKQRYY